MLIIYILNTDIKLLVVERIQTLFCMAACRSTHPKEFLPAGWTILFCKPGQLYNNKFKPPISLIVPRCLLTLIHHLQLSNATTKYIATPKQTEQHENPYITTLEVDIVCNLLPCFYCLYLSFGYLVFQATEIRD